MAQVAGRAQVPGWLSTLAIAVPILRLCEEDKEFLP